MKTLLTLILTAGLVIAQMPKAGTNIFTGAITMNTAAWGSITGTLSSQSDLNTALAAKVAGALSLTTQYTVPYTASSGTLTQDQYFKYIPWPTSPDPAATFKSLSITDLNSYVAPYVDGDNTFHAVYLNKGLTAIPMTNTAAQVYYNQLYNFVDLAPVASWNNVGVLRVYTTASRNAIRINSTSVQPIQGVLGIAGDVDNQGSGNVGEQNAMYWTNYHQGTGTMTSMKGMYVYNSSFGHGPATTMRGIDAYSGNDGYGATAVTTDAVGVFTILAYGDLTTAYALRTLKVGSGTVTTGWDLSLETGLNSRIQGNLAVGKSNATAPTVSLHVMDARATVGDTSLVVQSGAGQAAALQEWQNNSATALFRIASDGIPQFTSITEPTCNVGNRFKLTAVAGGAGVADTFRVCAKDAADAYNWTALF